jgi:hypothetical protein
MVRRAPDALGVHLPPALSAQGTATLLVPAGRKTPLNTVGAQPLPGQPGVYVAIVCTGGDVPTGPDDRKRARAGGAKSALQVYLDVVEAKEGAAPHLIPKPATVDGMVNWRDTGLPSAPDALDEAKGDTIRPNSFDGFDLAPYRISPDQRAFGIRGGGRIRIPPAWVPITPLPVRRRGWRAQANLGGFDVIVHGHCRRSPQGRNAQPRDQRRSERADRLYAQHERSFRHAAQEQNRALASLVLVVRVGGRLSARRQVTVYTGGPMADRSPSSSLRAEHRPRCG